MTTLIILAALALGGYFYMQQPQFGRNPEGAHLEKIKKSSHYKEKGFQNQHLTPDLAEGTTYWDILKAYFVKVENKEPNLHPKSCAPKSDASPYRWFSGARIRTTRTRSKGFDDAFGRF